MENNPYEAATDDFLEELIGIPAFAPNESGLAGKDGGLSGAVAHGSMRLQLSSGDGSCHTACVGEGNDGGGAGFRSPGFLLRLSLEQGKCGYLKPEEASGSDSRFGAEVVDGTASSITTVFQGLPITTNVNGMPQPPPMRPRVRARRGQATDPHSIAERLRRERIAERIRALQELVPSLNKTDKAAMLDEIVDYVKFLRLQVKVLSISRLGGAGAVAPLITDISLLSLKENESGGGRNRPAWEKWSDDCTERQVAKLLEENVGAAMQFLQSKGICLMPISLASAIDHTQLADSGSAVKPESNPPY